MTKPSLLLINRVYPPVSGATGRVLGDLARHFVERGWDVTILTTGTKAVLEGWEDGIRIRRVKAPAKPGGMLSYIWVFLKLFFAALIVRRRDLVITMTDPPFLVVLGTVLCKFKRTRHIHWCQDLYPDLLMPFEVKLPKYILTVSKNFIRAHMKKTDKIVAIGRCMARYLVQEGIPAPHIVFIPNWADLELLEPRPRLEYEGAPAPDAEVFDEILNGTRTHDAQIKHGPKFRVLYAGNVGLAHPLDTIMEAAEILNSPHPEIEFVFVGHEAQHMKIARERAHRQLDNIRLLPFQPPEKLKDLMESGDVHLVSQKYSTLGMLVPCKFYAALAAHRPCLYIGSPVSEVAGVIEEFDAGAVLTEGNGERLAEEIRQLRLNSDYWFAMHEGAAEASAVFRPSESFDVWDKVVETVMNDKIAEGGSA